MLPHKKKKYVLIDTDRYIDICFLDLEKNSRETLIKLEKLLNKSKFILLLPEVVELEFQRRFEEKVSAIESAFTGLRLNINNENRFGYKAKSELISSIKKAEKDINNDIKEVKKKIDEIFRTNCVRTGLEITPENLVLAYKFHLGRKKPYRRSQEQTREENNKKAMSHNIQPDCLLIASLISFMKDKGKYELYFASGNYNDFAEDKALEDKSKLKLHKDIIGYFKHIEYYFNPLHMLNENFDAKYSPSAIKKIDDKKKEGNTYVSERLSGLFIQTDPSQHLKINNEDGIRFNPRWLEDASKGPYTIPVSSVLGHINADTGISIFNNKTCRICSREYPYSPSSIYSDDGLCSECRKIYPRGSASIV